MDCLLFTFKISVSNICSRLLHWNKKTTGCVRSFPLLNSYWSEMFIKYKLKEWWSKEISKWCAFSPHQQSEMIEIFRSLFNIVVIVITGFCNNLIFLSCCCIKVSLKSRRALKKKKKLLCQKFSVFKTVVTPKKIKNLHI